MDSSQTKQGFTMINIKENDVLLGRGPFFYRNPGNIAFRSLIQSHVADYARFAPRALKRKIVEQLISKAQKIGCRFLVRAKNNNMWCEAHPYVVRSKVSHALRDARISGGGVMEHKILKLHDTPRGGKTKSNGKEILRSFTNCKILIEEGNSIPSIDRLGTCHFGFQEAVLFHARQQPKDLKSCAKECDAFFNLKTPEYRLGWNPNNFVNSMSFLSPSVGDCYPWNDSGVTNLKVLGHEHVHSIIPECHCSNSVETEVRNYLPRVATSIWCEGPSPKQMQN